jgi:hypothetical protein
MLPNLIKFFQKYENKVEINFKFDNTAKHVSVHIIEWSVLEI